MTAPGVTGAPASVGAVMDTVDALLHSLRMDSEVKAQHIARFTETRAAVAELIAADHAYDKASRAWDDGRFNDWDGVSDESRMKICDAFEKAAVRRADALARVGSAG